MDLRMDLRMDDLWQEPRLTLADLCAAIADGRVASSARDGHVEVTLLDLRRLEREDRVLRARFIPADYLANLDSGSLS